MKKKSHISLYLLGLLAVVVLGSTTAFAQRFAVATGNWNGPIWATTAGGVAGSAATPVAADAVTINAGVTVTVNVAATCASLTFTQGNPNVVTGATISGTNSLSITGALTISGQGGATAGSPNDMAVGSGTLSAGSVVLTGVANSGSKYAQITISTGTVTVAGNITSNGTECRITFSNAGTLNAGGTFLSGAAGTFTASTGTVNFNAAGPQAIAPFAYAFNNVILSGSGAKTLTNATINADLTLSGTATATTPAAMTIGGNLTVGTGTTFATGANNAWTLTVGGTTSVSGTLTLANTAAKTFTGDVTINTGGVWNETGAAAINYAGSLQNDGTTFTANTGVHTFSGAARTMSGASAISIATVTVSGTYTNNGTLTVGTALSGTGGLTQGTTGILNIGGTSGITTLTANAVGNTVNYTGGVQTVKTGIYDNLGLSGTGAKTTTGITVNDVFTVGGNAAVTVSAAPTYGTAATLQYNKTQAFTSGAEWPATFNGTGGVIVGGAVVITTNAAKTLGANVPLMVNAGATLATGANNAWTLTVGGTTSVSGTLTLANTAAKTFTGNVTMNTGGVWNETGAAAINYAGSLQNDGTTFTANTGVHTFSGTAQTISGTTAISIANVTVSGTYTNNGTLTVGTALSGTGDLTQGTTGILNIGGTSGITTLTADAVGNTVNFTGAAGQTIPGITYYDLGFSGGGTKTINTGTSITVGRNWAVGSAATMTTNANATVIGNITGAGAITMGSGTLTVAGDWTNNGAFTAGTGTVIYNGAAQIVEAATYNNLTFAGSNVKTLSGAAIVNGALAINTGSTLNTSAANNYAVTLNGDFVNGGTFVGNTSNITINGATAQSIDGFTTNGTITVTKTGGTATINGNVNAASLTYTNAAMNNGTIALGTGVSMTLSGALTMTRPANTATAGSVFAVDGGSLSCASITLGGTGVTAVRSTTLSISTGSVNVAGVVTPGGAYSYITFTGTGALNVGGNLGNGATFTASTGTVNYNGAGAQTIGNYIYNNLTLSNGGLKTEAAATVNGILSMEGDATISAAPTYGGAATLQYNTANARPAGPEWLATVVATGGVHISNTGTITMNSAEIVNAPVRIDNGASLATNNFALTFGDDFINNGGTFTAGSSNITITGTGATQSIAGFTTTGTVTMSKTAGTATMQGPMSCGLLTISGNGGTLNLGTALAHSATGITFTNGTLNLGSSTMTVAGAVALTTGALDLGSGTLNLTGNFSGAGTLTGGTGTMNFNGTAAQTAVGKATYNIVKINNAAGVTLTSPATIGTLTIGDITANSVFHDGGFQVTSTGTLNLASGTMNLGSATAATIWPSFATSNISAGTTVGYVSDLVGGQTISTAPSYQNLTFSGNAPKNIAAGGTLSVGGTWSLAGGLTTLATTANAAVSGSMTGNGAITMGSGTITVGGDWTNNGIFTQGTGTVNYNGTSVDQIVRGGVTYYNLHISNGSTKLLQVGNITVSNILTLNAGVLRIGDYNLILTNTAVGAIAGAPFSISNMIRTDGSGYVQKAGAADGTGINIIYPVGSGGYFNPLDLSSGFATSGGPGNIQITVSQANQGPNALSKNWTVAVNGYTGTITTNLRFLYDNAEVHGVQSNYNPWYFNGTSWVTPSGTPTAVGVNPFGTNLTNATAASVSGKWSAGSSSPATSVAYYSYQSGNWTDASSWTSDPSGTLWINPSVPGATDHVTILNGRTMTISANSKQAASLTINSGGILDIASTTGHNFGTVTGQGKIMLSSNNFPGGTFTNFVSGNTGTIEYYNLNSVSISTTQLTYNNLIISNYTGNTNSSYLDNVSASVYTINGNFNVKNYSSGTQTFDFGNPAASDNLIEMSVHGNFSVDAGCSLRVNNFASSHNIPNVNDNGATAYPVHTLNIYGNFANNGSVRLTGLPSPFVNAYYLLTATATGGINYGDVQVYFKGATNNTVTCNGITDFFRIVVEKGTDKTFTLEVSSSNTNNFALYAPNNQGNNQFESTPAGTGFGYGAYYKALFIHYGTLKLNEYITIPSLTEGGQDFNLIPTAGLWINGATVSTTLTGVNGTGYQAATLYGTLRISAGQFSTGDAAGIVLGTLGTPVIIIEGTGTLDVSQAWTTTGASNQMSYTQSGGTANFRMQGENQAGPMLGLSNVNSSFTMTGGTINFVDNAFIGGGTDFQLLDIQSQVGNYHVTGGTINFNLPGSATVYTARSSVPFYNLNIARRVVGDGPTVTIQWNTPGPTLNILNDLSIGANTLLNLNTSLVDLAVGRDFTIVTGGTYTPAAGAANLVTFNGSGSQAFNNTGTITGGLLPNLTITNSSTTTIVSNDVTVSGTLTIDQNAVLNDGGRYIRARGNIVNSGTHTGLPAGGIYLENAAAQIISGAGTGIFNNLILNKTAGSVTVAANISVTGDLRLAGAAGAWNILNIGNYTLSLGASAMVYSDMAAGSAFANNRMIQTGGLLSNGGVSKTFSNTTVFVYPFGFGANYMPASIQFSSAPSTYGSVNIKPVNARHALAQGTGNALTCYWKTTSTGFANIQAGSVRHAYTYTAAFVPVPGDEATYVARYYDNTSWITDASLVENAGTHTISYTAANASDGEFTAGLPAAFGSIASLYSVATGNWNVAATWSTTRGGTPGDGGTPTAVTPVIVCSGTTVTTTGSASSSRLTIEAGATLNLGSITGHNFGSIVNDAVTGSGTLRIASAQFPTGDWANFLGSAGGTVEYYQTAAGTLILPSTYTLSGGGTGNITSYYNLITSPYNTSIISLPNTNLTIYNNFTVGYSAGGGTTGCVTYLNTISTTTVEVKGNIIINQYGDLLYTNDVAENVIADNDILIDSGGALQVRNGGTQVANNLTVNGNITNNGTLDLDPNGGANYCNLLFTGTLNTSVSSSTTPARTHFYNIIVNKGTSMVPVVNVNIDPTQFQMGTGGLTLQNGTFRLTTNAVMPVSTGSFTIPSTASLSVNGGTLNIATGAGPADLNLNGKLEILAGTVNVGPAISSASANAFNLVYAMAGSPEISISGGFLNVYSQIRRGTGTTSGSLSYTQAGGTVSIGGKNPSTTRAAFEVVNGGSTFTMSNGSIIIANHVSAASPYDLYLNPDVENVTGGTIQFGLTGVTPANTLFYFQSSCSIGNLTLEATSNSSAIQQTVELTLVGNLTIGGTGSYYNTNSLNVTIGGNLTNNNTNASVGLNVGGYRAQVLTQSTGFVGNTDQTITGTSTNLTNFADVDISTAAGHSLLLNNCNLYVNDDLTLTSGTINDGGNTINVLSNVDNNAVHYSPNATTGGIIFNGTVNQAITGSGSGVFGNIEINNGGNGINLTDNSTINGQLKFTSGYLYIDNYALILGQTASIAGTINVTNQIILNGVATDGGVTKIFPSGAASFTYAFGANGKSTPCTFNFSSNTNSAGATIKIIPVDDLHPTLNPATITNYLSYYWNVTATGFTSSYNVQHTYTYIPADVQGTPAYIDRCDNATSAWSPVPTPTITPTTFSFNSTTLLSGSYTIGDDFTSFSLPTLFCIGSGDWNNPALWSRSSGGVGCGFYPNGHSVVIESGYTIALSVNGALASSVIVNGVLDAMNTTSHSIGDVSGGGTIRLLGTGSAMFVFPGGSYDGFLANPSSIVEYYGNTDATMPLTPGDINKPYQNVLITGNGIKYVSAVDIKILGNLTIASGSKLNNTLHNKDIFIQGNWIDNNAVTSGFTAGTGTVRFSGTAAQSFSMGNNSLKEPFYNLEINNAAGLTISSGNIDIDNQLLLTTGNINTSSTHVLTINNTAANAVVGGSVNSFVNGPLNKKINNNSSFQFPVGDAVTSGRNRFGYVSVTGTATTGTQTWTAQFFDKNPSVDGYDVAIMEPPLQSVINNEYWNIVGPAGGSANVVLSWDNYTGMSSSASTRTSDTKVVEWNSPVASKWNTVGAVVNDISQSSGTVATSIAVSLGNHIFTIGAMSSSVLISASQSGDWNNTSTWAGGAAPRPIDKVQIGNGMTVTLNTNPQVAELTVNSGGALVTGGTVDRTLSLTGNFILNGTWTNNGTGTTKISVTTGSTIYGTTGSISGTGTSILEIAGNSVIDATSTLTIPNVSIMVGKQLTNNGTVTVNSFSSGGTFENKAGSTLIFTGANLDAISLVAGECSNTIIYGGTDQAVKPVMHCTIIMRGGGTKTISNGTQTHGDVIQEVTVPVTNVIVNGDVVMQIDGGLVTGDGFVNNGDITINN